MITVYFFRISRIQSKYGKIRTIKNCIWTLLAKWVPALQNNDFGFT